MNFKTTNTQWKAPGGSPPIYHPAIVSYREVEREGEEIQSRISEDPSSLLIGLHACKIEAKPRPEMLEHVLSVLRNLIFRKAHLVSVEVQLGIS